MYFRTKQPVLKWPYLVYKTLKMYNLTEVSLILNMTCGEALII